MTPQVSVILPTHNRAALLRRSIQSVLAQTYRHFELIVVDDASSDATPEVVRAFGDARVHYLRFDQNRRAAAARNAGVARATGTLLAFQDDDDIWLPDKLTRQVAALQEAPAQVGLHLSAHVRLGRGTAVHIGGSSYFEGVRFDRGPFGDFSLVATPGWLLQRSLFERAGGFDERMRCWDDWELALRLAQHCRFAHLDEVLWIQDRRRDDNGGGMFDNRRNFANDLAVLLEKHAQTWTPQLVSRQWYLAGTYRASLEGTAAARPALENAVRADPGNVKARLALALARAGDRAWQIAMPAIRRVTGLFSRRRTFFDG